MRAKVQRTARARLAAMPAMISVSRVSRSRSTPSGKRAFTSCSMRSAVARSDVPCAPNVSPATGVTSVAQPRPLKLFPRRGRVSSRTGPAFAYSLGLPPVPGVICIPGIICARVSSVPRRSSVSRVSRILMLSGRFCGGSVLGGGLGVWGRPGTPAGPVKIWPGSRYPRPVFPDGFPASSGRELRGRCGPCGQCAAQQRVVWLLFGLFVLAGAGVR